MEVLMSSFQDRLHFGIQHELCDLMKISLLNAKRARILFDAGFSNLVNLAQASVEDVEKALANMGPFQ
jgi:DNA polymerase theta